MNESPEVGILVHELGGMLSSVQGFAHIASSNPAHADRERFIGLVASEARRAARAVRDLQLVRSLDAGRLPRHPPPLALGRVLAEVDGLDSDAVASTQVSVGGAELPGLIARCFEAAAKRVPDHACEVHVVRDAVEMKLRFGAAEDLDSLREAVAAPYPEMVPVAITGRLLAYWGGGLSIEANDGRVILTLRLPVARG